MAPFFTVVVPSLNQGRYLEQALRSLLQQNADDLQIIVVDGGSTDGTLGILEKFSEQVGGERFCERLACGNAEEEKPEGGGRKAEESRQQQSRTLELPHVGTRFLWCSEPDRGQSHAFNKGFARASGPFLFWLNADDLLLPGTLDRVRACLAAHGTAEWIAGNQIYIDAEGRVLRCSRGNRWHDFLYRHAPVHVYGPSSFFSKTLWERVGGADEQLRYCMDWDLWLKFRKAGARFERLNYYCWALRQHGGSKTQGGERDKEDVHWREIHAMCRRNGLEVTAAGVWFQRFWRLCAGCYAKSVIDTVKRRGHILKC
jgi:glycosyltransferase involved in cell wall biosynthesis